MAVQTWIKGLDGLWDAPGRQGIADRDYLVYGNYKPDATTTGHTGTLTPHVGDIVTEYSGQVIENLQIDGVIEVKHGGVVIRNCWIKSKTPPAYPAVFEGIRCYAAVYPSTRIVDCTIEASGYPVVASQNGIQGRDYIAERCNIHSFVDGVKANYGNVQILGCWIHDLPHYETDPFQVDGSHNDGIQAIAGASDTGAFVFRGNVIECGSKGTSGILVTQPSGTQIYGLTIDKNWVLSTITDRPTATATGINLSQLGTNDAFNDLVVTGNRFTPWSTGWATDHDGLIDDESFDVATISGNVWDTDGTTPAKITRLLS